MRGKDIALGGLLVAGSTALVFAAHASLTPQLNQLFEIVGMHGAQGIAFGLTTILLGAAALVGARGGQGARAIAYAIIGLTACVALTRAKVVGDRLSRAKAVYQAELTAYETAKANRDAAIAEAAADPDLNAKAPYLNRKRDARAALSRARAMALPDIPVEPSSGVLTWVIAVGGPAGIEAVTAVLIELLGVGLGAGWALLLGPLFVRTGSATTELEAAEREDDRTLDLESPTSADRTMPMAPMDTQMAETEAPSEAEASGTDDEDEDDGEVLVGPRGGRYKMKNGRRVYLRGESSADLTPPQTKRDLRVVSGR